MPPVTGTGLARAGRQGRAAVRELMDDRLLDPLLERSRDEAGGLRLTGEGSMLGELVPLRDVQEAASHAHPRTTIRCDRARGSLDRHATYVVAAYVACAAR